MRDQSFDAYAAANLDAMSEAVAYQAAMRQLVFNKLKLQGRQGALLDFGAGNGDYAKALRLQTTMRVIGLEPDRALHSSFPESIPIVEDLFALPGESLDAVYSLNVLEHIENDARAIRELAARCRPGAHIFLLVPANPKLWTQMDVVVGHHRRYMPDDLQFLAKQAGLSIVDQGWFDLTGYAATRAYQLLQGLGLVKRAGAGRISKRQILWFDRLFRICEPILSCLRLPLGKNCWILVQVPGKNT